MIPEADVQGQLRNRAIALLSRREYSRAELRQRLAVAGQDGSELEAVLDQLVEQGLQSDSRFADSFVRSRIGRGQGVQRIRQELRHKGVAGELAEWALEQQEVDWFALARQVFVRRFGAIKIEDRKLEAKCLRFLLYRGFSQDQARFALSADDDQL